MVKNITFFIMLYLGHNQEDADNWAKARSTLFSNALETEKKLNNLDKEKCYNA